MNFLELKIFREELGVSREDLANMLDISINTLNTWEYRTNKIPNKNIKKIKDLINLHTKTETYEKEKKVPYYDIDVTSHITTSFSDVLEKPTFYVDYQPFNDCTAYVNNYGDSMFPKYKNGEKLAVKQIQNLDVLMFGETYLVITNENANNLKTVKEVHYHEDQSKLILRASNPAYKGDTIIDKVDILSMFAVKGKISQNFI
jgi:transcriptional regulator with XRE-family HTH domain